MCIMETLVPEDASKTKDEVEAADDDEVWNMTLYICIYISATILSNRSDVRSEE